MKTKTKVSGFIFSICGFIATIISLYLLIKDNPVSIAIGVIQSAFWIAVSIEALIYFAKGGRKEDSRFFKAFAWTFMLGFVFNMLIMVVTPLQITNENLQSNAVGAGAIFVLEIIAYSCFLLLAYSKDLGVVKSARLSYVAVINMLIIIFIQIILMSGLIPVLVEQIARLCLIIVYSNIFVAKYEDKEARGTD